MSSLSCCRLPRGAVRVLAATVLGLGPVSIVEASESSASQSWVRRYDGPQSSQDGGQAVAVSPDGSKVFVTGHVGEIVEGVLVFDYGTAAYRASDGEILWQREYDGPGRHNDEVSSMAISPNGKKVFVTGTSWVGESNDYDVATVAYNARNGTRLWAKHFDGGPGRDDGGRAITVDPNGRRIFVTGSIRTEGRSSDLGVLAYSMRTGKRLWVRRHGGQSADTGVAIDASIDGRVVVTGWTTNGTTSQDYATLAYKNKTGRLLWAKSHRGNGADFAESVVVGSGGSKVYVTGWSQKTVPNNSTYTTIAYASSNGKRLWLSRYDGAGAGAYAESVVASPSGTRVFVTGWSEGATSSWDYATLAYKAGTGDEAWLRRYDAGGAFDGASSLAVSPDGSTIYVTGSSESATLANQDYATLAYSARGGKQQWVVRYDGPSGGTDGASSLAVSPDGTGLYVSGASNGVLTGFSDYATVAYAIE